MLTVSRYKQKTIEGFFFNLQFDELMTSSSHISAGFGAYLSWQWPLDIYIYKHVLTSYTANTVQLSRTECSGACKTSGHSCCHHQEFLLTVCALT